MVLGTDKLAYNQYRNFASLPFDDVEVLRIRNFNYYPAYIQSLAKYHNHYLWNKFVNFDAHSKVDVYHFFNTLSTGTTPWFTTFETALPRWGQTKYYNTFEKYQPNRDNRLIEEGLNLIARDSCQRIIALSECTANIQTEFVKAYFPAYDEVIERKMLVLHPGQKVLVDDINSKSINNEITFVLVGADFFRKGGKEILLAFDTLYTRGIKNWKLHVVSKLKYGDYASKTDVEDYQQAMKLIDKHKCNIHLYHQLDNREVLNMLKSADVGLLPTYADTYGYSVLEAQACGCPVITTNVRALPEINRIDIGWLIDLPKDHQGNAVLKTPADRAKVSALILEGLLAHLETIFYNPEVIKKKGQAAIKKIAIENAVHEKAAILRDLYRKALLPV